MPKISKRSLVSNTNTSKWCEKQPRIPPILSLIMNSIARVQLLGVDASSTISQRSTRMLNFVRSSSLLRLPSTILFTHLSLHGSLVIEWWTPSSLFPLTHCHEHSSFVWSGNAFTTHCLNQVWHVQCINQRNASNVIVVTLLKLHLILLIKSRNVCASIVIRISQLASYAV